MRIPKSIYFKSSLTCKRFLAVNIWNPSHVHTFKTRPAFWAPTHASHPSNLPLSTRHASSSAWQSLLPRRWTPPSRPLLRSSRRPVVLICYDLLPVTVLKGDSVVVRPLTWVVNAEERAAMWPCWRLFSVCVSGIKAAHSAGLGADVLHQCLQEWWFSQHSGFYLWEKWGR